jgi:AraC family transcriptional activator of mtrCDE
MKSPHILDRLLVTMDVAVQNFAVCEVRKGKRLVGAAVDGIMIHYVLAGTMHMTIPGHEPIACGPGCVALIPPGLEPSMTADGGEGAEVIGVEHASLGSDGLLVFDAADGGEGDLRLVAGIVRASLSGSFGLLDRLKVPIAENMSDSVVVRHAYGQMLDEIQRPGLGSRAITGALMKTCLLMVLRRFFSRRGKGQGLIGALADPRLAPAVAMILEQPSADHNVAALADRVGMGRSTFARHFTRTFEMSPMEFVAKTRLYHAAEMLRSTMLPVKVIAASIGFSSRSHFSRAFRDAYHMDPSQYRSEHSRPATDAPRRLRGSRERFALPTEPE